MKFQRSFNLFASVALAVTLSACGDASEKSASSSASSSDAAINAPDAKPGIAASEGRLVLPVIANRPAAAYFVVRNESAATVTLAGVHIAGAGKAEMHETKAGSMQAVPSVQISAGGSATFAPGGLHVMAFELASTLSGAETAELTLTFSDGDKLSMPLHIEKMGTSAMDTGSHH